MLTEWQSLKMAPYESTQKYVDKFWELHLKATVYKQIDFAEQKQQFCAGLPEEISEYVNSQRPKTISVSHTSYDGCLEDQLHNKGVRRTPSLGKLRIKMSKRGRLMLRKTLPRLIAKTTRLR